MTLLGQRRAEPHLFGVLAPAGEPIHDLGDAALVDLTAEEAGDLDDCFTRAAACALVVVVGPPRRGAALLTAALEDAGVEVRPRAHLELLAAEPRRVQSWWQTFGLPVAGRLATAYTVLRSPSGRLLVLGSVHGGGAASVDLLEAAATQARAAAECLHAVGLVAIGQAGLGGPLVELRLAPLELASDLGTTRAVLLREHLRWALDLNEGAAAW